MSLPFSPRPCIWCNKPQKSLLPLRTSLSAVVVAAVVFLTITQFSFNGGPTKNCSDPGTVCGSQGTGPWLLRDSTAPDRIPSLAVPACVLGDGPSCFGYHDIEPQWKGNCNCEFHRGYNLPITIWCMSARSEVFIGLWKDATCLLASE